LIKELEVADNEVVISGRDVYNLVGADAFVRDGRQHLDTHDAEQRGTDQPGAASARPIQHLRQRSSWRNDN
jgi:hypothetical protein